MANEFNNLLVKQFQEHNITIYGTFEKPLFKAKDIGDLLGITQIRKTIQNLDDNFKLLQAGNTNSGLQEQYFLTIDGLYEVLFISRKPIAKEFRSWVRKILEEIRKTGEYKSNREIEYKTKNNLFIEQYQNKPILYLGMVEDKEEQQIIKYGHTTNPKTTIKRHQESYGEEFHLIYALECKQNYTLENKIQNHNDLTSRHIKKYNGKDRQELLRLDDNFNRKDLINLILKMKEIMDNDKEINMRELDIQEKEINLEEKKLAYKKKKKKQNKNK